MNARRWFELGYTVLFLGTILLSGMSWLAEHDARLRLDATVHDQQQVIGQAQARAAARDRAVADQVAEIERERTAVKTPAQAAVRLAQIVPLPQPIILPAVALASAPVPDRLPAASVQASGTAEAVPLTRTQAEDGPMAEIPQADLKPLYDFAQGCRETTLRLDACQSDLSDRQQELTAVETERDAAVAAVHGGTFWHRLADRAKWLAIGVGVGVGLGVLEAHR